MKNLEEELDSFKAAIKLLSESVEELDGRSHALLRLIADLSEQLSRVIDDQVKIAESTGLIADAVHKRLCRLEEAAGLGLVDKVEDLPKDLN